MTENTNIYDYDYFQAVENDVKDYIMEIYTIDDLRECYNDKSDLYDELCEDLFINDSVTGNASGSYTFNTYKAECYLAHNWDLAIQVLYDFGYDSINLDYFSPEWLDVTIRCGILSQCIYKVLDDLNSQYDLWD